MKRGKWNIIIRTQGKNNESELKNALYSVVAQNYKYKSIILIIHSDNDSIIKKTKDFLKNFEDLLEIRSVVARKKQEVRAYPLNTALKYIDGEFISFLDHDDIYYPYMGTVLINNLIKKKKTFALGRSISVQQRIKTDIFSNNYLYTKHKSKRKKEKFNKLLLLLDNYIPFNTFILKTDLIGDTKFDERLEFLEDWDFLKKLLLKEEFSHVQIDTPVSEYRTRNDETDTYNDESFKRWLKARRITDNNFKDEYLTTEIKELLFLRKNYVEEFNRLNKLIQKVEKNRGYRIWEGIKNIQILEKTIVRGIREIRHLIKD